MGQYVQVAGKNVWQTSAAERLEARRKQRASPFTVTLYAKKPKPQIPSDEQPTTKGKNYTLVVQCGMCDRFAINQEQPWIVKGYRRFHGKPHRPLTCYAKHSSWIPKISNVCADCEDVFDTIYLTTDERWGISKRREQIEEKERRAKERVEEEKRERENYEQNPSHCAACQRTFIADYRYQYTTMPRDIRDECYSRNNFRRHLICARYECVDRARNVIAARKNGKLPDGWRSAGKFWDFVEIDDACFVVAEALYEAWQCTLQLKEITSGAATGMGSGA